MTNQFLEEIAQGPNWRANVPEGTPIGEQEIEPGANVGWKKPKSMMRIGDQALPDRMPLYDLNRRDMSMVPPTIANARMAKYPGRFTTVRPKDWDKNRPQPIDDTCVICLKRREEETPGAGPKPFFSESDLILHYQYMHTNEWAAMERNREIAERREEQGQMRALIGSLVGLIRPDALSSLPAEVRDQMERLSEAEKPRRGRKVPDGEG